MLGRLIVWQQRLQNSMFLAIVRMIVRLGRLRRRFWVAMRVFAGCGRGFGHGFTRTGNRGANDLANLHTKQSQRQ